MERRGRNKQEQTLGTAQRVPSSHPLLVSESLTCALGPSSHGQQGQHPPCSDLSPMSPLPNKDSPLNHMPAALSRQDLNVRILGHPNAVKSSCLPVPQREGQGVAWKPLLVPACSPHS